jgi:hypothetical protein
MEKLFEDPSNARYKNALATQAESTAAYYDKMRTSPSSGVSSISYNQTTGQETTSDDPEAVTFLVTPTKSGPKYTKLSAPTSIFDPQSGTSQIGGRSTYGGIRSTTPIGSDARGELASAQTVETAIDKMEEAMNAGEFDDFMGQAYADKNFPMWMIPEEYKPIKTAINLFRGTFPFMRGGKQLTVPEQKSIDVIMNPMGQSRESLSLAFDTLRKEGTLRKLLILEGRTGMVNNQQAGGNVFSKPNLPITPEAEAVAKRMGWKRKGEK